jgi:hypothetical protein
MSLADGGHLVGGRGLHRYANLTDMLSGIVSCASFALIASGRKEIAVSDISP